MTSENDKHRAADPAIVSVVKSTQRAAIERLFAFKGAEAMTLLDLAIIAKRYDTVVAHAMLQAVAIAKAGATSWAIA